jgi:hypothetical protein
VVSFAPTPDRARRHSLPVSLLDCSAASRTSRGSSESAGTRRLQVTVRSSTTSGGLFVKKVKESFEDSFHRCEGCISWLGQLSRAVGELGFYFCVACLSGVARLQGDK